MDLNDSELLADLGAAVRRARQKGGWSQETFAERCDLSTRYISNLERGTQEPGLFALRRVAAGAGVKVSALLRRVGQ